jgi:hypothetical protein
LSVELTTLPNGFRIASEYMPGLESAAIGVWVMAGARHERAEQNGIAHFLEHMAFKGTKRRSALQIAEAIEDVGGYINAYTSREVTAYYARVLKDDVPLAMDVVADILHRCLSTGEYRPDGVAPTISPSMDIQVSSNFERALYYAYGQDGRAVAQVMDELKAGGFSVSQGALESLREVFDSGRADEDETRAAIRATWERSGELLCPHSAVGVHVAEAQRAPGVPMITLATAHPAKFPAAVEEASGIHPPLPGRMADLYDRPERLTRVGNDLAAIETLIKERIAN